VTPETTEQALARVSDDSQHYPYYCESSAALSSSEGWPGIGGLSAGLDAYAGAWHSHQDREANRIGVLTACYRLSSGRHSCRF
jgi:hypothetical protein